MRTRKAKVSDINGILVLMDQIAIFHSTARPDWIDNKKRPINREFLEKCIKDEGWEIFVAEEKSNIIGYCVVKINEIKNHFIFYDMVNIEVQDLCVDERYQKKGYGRKLFEKVKKYAQGKQANYIELSVWEFNQNAIKFYEHLGMKKRINRMELKI